MMALNGERLRLVGQFLQRDLRPLRQRDQFYAGNPAMIPFALLAHIDEPRRRRARERRLQLAHRDFRNLRPHYISTETGVPTLTLLKYFAAMNPGMRMQPCDAG